MQLTILGLGYIGLPTAAMFANRDFNVTGIDVNEEKVEEINKGIFRLDELGLKAFLRDAVNSGNLKASTEPEESDVFIICVPTPLTEDKKADLSYVENACEMIYPYLKKGDLIILESTVPPGTTKEVMIPILERSGLKAGEDLKVCHCPERVMPGNTLQELVENDRIIGGIDQESIDAAKKLYLSFVKGEIYTTDPTTAEIVKLVENTYRDTNIALANELAKICERNKSNVWDVIELANNHPRVHLHKPGPGVGGHCLPIDPWFLIDGDGELIKTARKVNDGMVDYIKEIIDREVPEGKITILGATYKANTEDTRMSPTLKLVEKLKDREVTVHDPLLEEYNSDIIEAVKGAEALILMVDHDAYLDLPPENILKSMVGDFILDTRNFLDKKRWEKHAAVTRTLGLDL